MEAVASPELASCTGYLPGGIGWYRKDLDIPKVQNGNKVYIYFEGIYNNSEVFINGKWIGKRPNGYVSFMYELTPYLKFGGRNVLAVRCRFEVVYRVRHLSGRLFGLCKSGSYQIVGSELLGKGE